MPELPTSPTRRSDRQLEAWASTLMGNLDMESAAGREAFSALVKYAREKDAESRQKGALLLEAEEEIDKRDRAGESHLERWASTLLGEFDFDSAAGREALNALVEYAREKEREAREQARQLAEAEAQIEDLEAQLKDAPESPTGVQAILELEEMVEILEAENKELQESNDARARALRDALDDAAAARAALEDGEHANQILRDEVHEQRHLAPALERARDDVDRLRDKVEEQKRYIEALEEELVDASESLERRRERDARPDGALEALACLDAHQLDVGVDASPRRNARTPRGSSGDGTPSRDPSPRGERPAAATPTSPKAPRPRPPSSPPPSAPPLRDELRRLDAASRERTSAINLDLATAKASGARTRTSVTPRPSRSRAESDATRSLSRDDSSLGEAAGRSRASSLREDTRERKKRPGLRGLAPPTRPFQFPRAQPVTLPSKIPVALSGAARAAGRYDAGFGADAPAPLSPPLASPGGIDVGLAPDGTDLWRAETPVKGRARLDNASPVNPSYSSSGSRIQATPEDDLREHF